MRSHAKAIPLVFAGCLVLSMSSAFGQSITRGPYLQRGTAHAIVVRWRTDTAVSSRVLVGQTPQTLTLSFQVPGVRTEHEVLVTGLAPKTDFYYAVGTIENILAGGDADHSFRTAPLPGTREPLRVWVIGDSGTSDASALAVRTAYEAFAGTTHTDLWLMLGDNAYASGTDAEYQAAVFDMYPGLLRRSVVWPTMGNHEAFSAASATESGPYYDIFTLPRQAEAGGLVTGTEAYYSFDFANVHFICLNSQDASRDPAGPMLTWLQADLAETAQDWIVAYWHHPPYSKGSHDSDSAGDSGGRLQEMRENALPILEDWGVDLVLGGHSHSYERSFLLDGHYGVSSTLIPAMVLDAGDGRVDGTGAYQKAASGPAGHLGAVYTVAGSSGLTQGGTLDHPAMFSSLNVLGSVVLDFEGDRLDASFLTALGAVGDRYTVVKNAGTPPDAEFDATPRKGIVPLNVVFDDLSTTNAASWAWDLDGDGATDSVERAPAFLYGAPGTYSVTLEVSNAAGQTGETKTGFICVASSAPGPVAGLTLQADKSTLNWSSTPGATGYDVIRGGLAPLRAAGGDFGAAGLVCLADDQAALQIVDSQGVPSGGALFYLVRAVGPCGVGGSYGPAGAAPATCP